MAKNIDLTTAGYDFTNSVLTLYKSEKRYKNEGVILSEMLLNKGVEAGALIQRYLQSSILQEKIDLAKNCLLEIEKTMHLANVMEYNKILTAKSVKVFRSFAVAIKDVLVQRLKELKAVKPTVKYREIPNFSSAGEKPAPVIIGGDDGFNDEYTG